MAAVMTSAATSAGAACCLEIEGMDNPARERGASIFAPHPVVTVAKYIAALAIALGVGAAPAALAAPAGSEYLPQVPKTSHHHSSDGGDSSTTDSSSGYSSGYTSTQDSSAPDKKKPAPQPKHKHPAKLALHSAKVPAEADSGNSGAVVPIALALIGAISLAGGLLTRRRQRRQLKYQAEKRRRLEALEG
jgi:hypothetical protein